MGVVDVICVTVDPQDKKTFSFDQPLGFLSLVLGS